MLTGRSFLLTTDVLGVQKIDGKFVAVTIPAKAVIRVTSGPTPTDSRLVEVVWDGDELLMFAEDVQNRGREVKGGTAGHQD